MCIGELLVTLLCLAGAAEVGPSLGNVLHLGPVNVFIPLLAATRSLVPSMLTKDIAVAQLALLFLSFFHASINPFLLI